MTDNSDKMIDTHDGQKHLTKVVKHYKIIGKNGQN